ncbi:hypothetical protein C8A05DRAFT_30370 [Staphylotrichum tortipilum]|uniref:Uncharacterized protein n=1 Tax=Staphylotrichum tortipilum TaxID=2831512 RepID=A0AAN6MTQ9_9PEZI|nr:hypothetical protein C8A05DRAFT_30370 [Staphylotrichum longicolle]
MRPAQFPPDPTTASSTNPAANKRRRIEAANATLRKPFRSPLVSRRQQQPTPGHGTETGGEGSPTVNRTSHALTPARSGGGRPPLLPADGGKDGRKKGGGDEKDESEREKGEEEDHVGEEKEEEIEELEFTMLMMLKSLNIDPDVLGYDAVEERWRD